MPVVSLLLLSFLSVAPTTVVEPLSLAQASALAEQQSPELAEARAGVPVAEAGVEVAGQLPNPVANVTVGPDYPTYTAGLTQRLPVFGQRGTALRAAEAQVEVSRAQLALKRVELRASVRRSYFALLQVQSETRLAEDRLQRAHALARAAQERFDAGSASQLEVEQARLAEERANQAREDKDAEARSSREALAVLIGLPLNVLPEAKDLLLPLPSVPPLEALLAHVPAHPEVAVAERQVRAARARAVREGAALRPTPELSITAESLDPQGTRNGSGIAFLQAGRLGLRAGLAFDLPLLSWNRGAVHEAEREAAQAEAVRSAALRRRLAAARVAYSRWDAAVRRSRFLEQVVVPQALHVEQLARVAYNAGRAPLVFVLQAQGDVTDVQDQAVGAAATAQAAFADIEEAVGESL